MNSSSKQTVKKYHKNVTLLRRGMVGILGLLIIQFIVGMYLNFYVELPKAHPGINGSYAPSIPWALTGGAGIALAIHVTVWILLTVGGIALVIRAIMSRRKAFIVGTSFGLLFILIAGSGGLTFLNRGGQDKESMMMAVGFIFAVISYVISFDKTKDNLKQK